jgi:superfamily II DNA or RNA helicase
MEIQLRPYQQKIIQSLREELRAGKRRIMMCAPTGSGKTVMFSYMISKHLEKGGRALVFTHRKELLKQAGGTFEKFGLKAELITAGSTPDLTAPLHVSMIETFDRRKNEYEIFLSSRTLIVFDEAHLNIFTKIFPFILKGVLCIGATATPYRKGKKIPALETFYQSMVQQVDTPELLQQGFLCPARSFGVPIDLSGAEKKGDDYDVSSFYEENKMWHGVVSNWERLTPGTKTLLFSSNVEMSIRVAKEFRDRGYPAEHIDGTTPKRERENILEWFDRTPDAIVCNCGILNAGFDQPDISTVILYRATTSLPLFLQMCGRGSRLSPGKEFFNILDFGNNIPRLGFWEDPRVWSLKNDQKRTTKEDAALIKLCPKCTAIVPVSSRTCPHCFREFQKSEEEKDKEEIARLQLLEKKDLLREANGMENRKLALLSKAKLISPFWVLHNKTDIHDAREFCKMMGYKMPGFEYANRNRFKIFSL